MSNLPEHALTYLKPNEWKQHALGCHFVSSWAPGGNQSTTLAARLWQAVRLGSEPRGDYHCLAFEQTRDLRSVLKIFGLVTLSTGRPKTSVSCRRILRRGRMGRRRNSSRVLHWITTRRLRFQAKN